MPPLKPLPPPSLTLVSRPEDDREVRLFEHADEFPFDGQAIGFSPRNAWWLAEASLLTYWPPDEAWHIFRDGAGFDSELIASGGTECHVAWNDAAAVVAFRGLQRGQPIDVWTDIDAQPVPWGREGERVHEGFKHAVNDELFADVAAELRAVGVRTVWVTGHGLGGALATLFADRWRDVAGLYTFGSPRVGDAAFAHGFSHRHAGRSFRYVNGRDAIARVPPLHMTGVAFAHVDREVRIDGQGRIGDAAGFSIDADAEVDGAERFVPALALTGPVIDHAPRRYAVFAWNALVAAMAPAGAVRYDRGVGA